MKRTYRFKVVKRAWIDVTVDSEQVDQKQAYEIASERAKNSKTTKWGEPTLSITEIINDSDSASPKSPKVNYEDPEGNQ